MSSRFKEERDWRANSTKETEGRATATFAMDTSLHVRTTAVFDGIIRAVLTISSATLPCDSDDASDLDKVPPTTNGLSGVSAYPLVVPLA